MRSIHILRKPCSEPTVAANVIRHGTGAINVDATRIHSGPSESGNTSGETALGQGSGWNAYNNRTTAIDRTMSAGRWPANLVLQHLDGCVQDGAKKVKVIGAGAHRKEHRSHSWVAVVTQPHEHAGFRDPDGTETVAAWNCAPGCPVAGLDAQSGDLSSQATRRDPDKASRDTGMFGVCRKQKNGPEYLGQTGGASRFFKQVKP